MQERVGVDGKPKAGETTHGHRDRAIVCSVKHKTAVYLSGQDGRSQQLDTARLDTICSLISAHQWYHMDCHEFTGSQKCCL